MLYVAIFDLKLQKKIDNDYRKKLFLPGSWYNTNLMRSESEEFIDRDKNR